MNPFAKRRKVEKKARVVAATIPNLGVGEIVVVNGIEFYVELYQFDGKRTEIRLSDVPQKDRYYI